jgi:hypothetical protein
MVVMGITFVTVFHVIILAGYSTHEYLTLIQGSIVNAASFLSQLISQSSAEAEYMIYAHSMLAGPFIQKCSLNPLENILINL